MANKRCCTVRISLKSFVLGFGCAALSLGAVTHVNAASDTTIKACANKKTGAMRYTSSSSFFYNSE
jgi:hypothetical protein